MREDSWEQETRKSYHQRRGWVVQQRVTTARDPVCLLPALALHRCSPDKTRLVLASTGTNEP